MAREVFASLETEFSHLTCRFSEDPHDVVQLELLFPAQPGLCFQVVAHLQGDELCLGVGDAYWSEYFPSEYPEVVLKFQETMRGVIRGDIRLVEYHRGGKIIKARLERQSDAAKWETVGRWATVRWPSFRRPEARSFQNR